MGGIALGILINFAFYLLPIFCFFATIYFGFKAINNSEKEIKPNKSKPLSILSACVFLFLVFVWPGDFRMFMQNLELFKTIYLVQITLAPISVLLFSFWLKKRYGKSTAANLLILYGLIDLSTKAPKIIESIYKISINDHRPYATGFTKFISRYMFQINLVSTAVLLLAIYSLYVILNREKSNQTLKRTG